MKVGMRVGPAKVEIRIKVGSSAVGIEVNPVMK
jgi:hypothetical protein